MLIEVTKEVEAYEKLKLKNVGLFCGELRSSDICNTNKYERMKSPMRNIERFLNVVILLLKQIVVTSDLRFLIN